MADLSKKDREWYSREIQTQVDAAIKRTVDEFRPHGLRRVTHFVKEWGLAGTIVSALIALLALAGAGWWNAFSRVEKQATFEANTTNTLTQILKRLDGLENRQNISILRQKDAPPDEIAKAARELQQQSVVLPRTEVAETAQSLLSQAATTGDKRFWEAATSTLGYISFLNHFSSPSTANLTQVPYWATQYQSPSTWKLNQVGTVGQSLAPEVPQLHGLDQSDLNAGKSGGPAFLVIAGGTAKLDRVFIKRVIFLNVHIVYDGGAIHMENVYFVNCTFDLRQEIHTTQFAQALVLTAKTDFSVS